MLLESRTCAPRTKVSRGQECLHTLPIVYRSSSHVEDGFIDRSENVWEEYTDLDGFHVSANILPDV